VDGLYRLEKGALLELDRMGDRLATKILANVEASKERPLHRLLFALGVLHVGSEVAELLTQQYASLDDLASASEEELTEIPGVGPKIAGSLVAYFKVPHNWEVIEKLRRAEVKLYQESHGPRPRDLPLHGVSFVVTGTLASILRREAEVRIKALGGSVVSSVTRKTNYLVAGASPGSKLDAAQRLGTRVLDEAEFSELLESPPSPKPETEESDS
jgi:DNA ligase (NAD+)